MIKKMLGVFTSVIAALAVVGVAWAGADDATSASVPAAREASTSVSMDDSSSSTDATIASSTDATVASSTGGTVGSTTTSIDGRDDDSTTSTSIDDRDDDDITTATTIESTTSTTIDDNDSRAVSDGESTYQIPGVGEVTIEVVAGRLVLVDVSAPGWEIEEQRVEADRVELELFSGEAEAEFEARIDDGRIEVRVEVD